jgi:glycosyltransferase involved in cell wall biosynthesis
VHTTGIVDHLAGSAGTVTAWRGAPAGDRRTARVHRAPDLTTDRVGDVGRAPDLVIGVVPALAAAVAAARTARRHDVPLVLVVHDLVSARPTGRYGARGLRFAEAVERRVLRRAAEVAVVNPDLGAVVRTLGVPAEHVHLMPRWTGLPAADHDRAAARRALGWADRPFTVLHPVPASGRPDPEAALAAAALLDASVDLMLVGEGAAAAAHRVRQARRTRQSRPGWALREESTARIRVAEAADDAGFRRLAAAADLLLVTQRPDTAGPCVPQTLIDCLGAARPVLAAAPDDSAVAAELDRAAGAGLLVRPGDPVVLAAAVRALQLDGALRAAMGAGALRYARERLDRARAMARLDGIMESALPDAEPRRAR